MKPVTVEIEIAGPPAVVWQYLANAEYNPEWLRNMSSCRWITDPPIRVGSRYEQVARFLGKKVRTGGDPSGFYRVAEAPMRVMVRHNIDRAYRRLKHLLENRIDA